MSTEIPVKGATMIHDFAITESDAIFWELPVVFDLDAAIAMVQGKTDGAFPFRWDPSYGARVGVLPLGGQGSETRWFDLDPCFVFHGVNAFRDGDAVVVDVCRLASVFDTQLVGGALTLRRWTIDTVTGRVADDVLADHDPGELPTRDPRVVGRTHRHAYLVQSRERPETVDLGGLIKHDFLTGARDVWDPGPSRHGGEWLFVPDPDGTADDEGWVLGFVHDEATATTDFVVIDASAVSSGPVASVRLPQRVPYGFHATWVAG
jgi:carotenoid cleavage dioxygenase